MRTRFDYQRAGTTSEAIEMLADLGDEGYVLAGGTDLYLDWKNGKRLGTVVDVSHLADLAFVEDGGEEIRIGSLTSLRTLEHLPHTDNVRRSLASLARVMCTPQTRTLGTVGGNIANSSAAADLPPLLAALGAAVHLVGPAGRRVIAVEDVAAGPKRNNLALAELITNVQIPAGPGVATYVRRATRTSLDIALVIAAVSLTVGTDGRIAEARICLGSVGPRPIRALDAESALVGEHLADLAEDHLEASGRLAAAASSPIDDMRASAAYRRYVTAVLTTRALGDAVSDLREGRWAA
jgi:aerobic carbon-monoxide dehydrogenase medium subunit